MNQAERTDAASSHETLAVSRETDSRPVFFVSFDDDRLIRLRPHHWVDARGVTRISGVDHAWFSNKRLAEVFASIHTFRGAPAAVIEVR